ncbi:phosphopantetheine-binding protein [Kitasatospora sp. NPDC051853]|uniref:phosphopantetheine-binding protein n=1 Tax=Kitasatospora sp. NPDC051853 TaxID=3364058 RepID=UPI0037905DA3
MGVPAIPDSVDSTSRESVEEFLLAVWTRALNVGEITVEDNFFELGGDSLVALEILVAIDEAIESEVGITELYEQPTVRELAGYIVGAGAR